MALTESGQLRKAETLLDVAVEEAIARGDRVAEAHAIVARLFARLQVDTEASASEICQRFDALRSTFQREGDDLGLNRLWRLRALVHWIGARSADADAAWERAAEHARRGGDEQGLADALVWLASSAYVGPTRVETGIARCEAIRAQLGRDRRTQAGVLDSLAGLWAMQGEFATARRMLDERNAILAELGRTMHSAVSHPQAFVALAAGDAAAAEASCAMVTSGSPRWARRRSSPARRRCSPGRFVNRDAMMRPGVYPSGRGGCGDRRSGGADHVADGLSARNCWRSAAP